MLLNDVLVSRERNGQFHRLWFKDTSHGTTRNLTFHSGQLIMVLEFAKEIGHSYMVMEYLN